MSLKYFFKLSLVTVVYSTIFNPQITYSKSHHLRSVNSSNRGIIQGKNKLIHTKNKLQQSKAQVAHLKKKESETNFKIAILQQKIETSSIKLEDAKFRYEQTQKQIKITDVKLKDTEKELKGEVKATRSSIRRLYKYKYVDFFTFILSSEDLSTLMRRSVYFNYIIKKDNESINEIKKKKKEIHDLKMDYKDKQVKIVKISQKISEQKNIYQEASEDQADYLQKVQHQKSFYEKETQALENESSRISSMLQNMAYQQKLAMQRYLAMKKEYARTGRKYASISMPRSMSYGGGRMGMPCSAGVTSYFGYRVHPIFGTRKLHTGIDFGAATGTPIYAASNGVVINAGWTGGYGKAIIIDHGGGIATLYGHTSQMYVSVGQSVKRGQLIAAIGTTGFSTGPHLHFEVRAGGSPVDPLPYLR